ncbi:hypothetical protein [Exiguobacterium sp. s146]|uniref:hypothetical protein n=1 Tax=Exiguobacterium sp. s146 TaxID=2751223 RepID=UPI001BE66227|nr:hypothetical protein [Exiguobacterium sp. s146]
MMQQINEKSVLLTRLIQDVEDMSHRIEGKERKKFLYKKIDLGQMQDNEIVDDFLTLRYIAGNRMDEFENLLKEKLHAYESALVSAIEESFTERITYNEELLETVTEELVPYYHGRFQINLSREISFLPLELRLLLYTKLLAIEPYKIIRYNLLDRISLTLYKSGDSRLGEYATFLKTMLGVELAPLIFKTEKRFEELFWADIGANEKIETVKEEILDEANLYQKTIEREFWYGFKSMSDLKNINDVHAAKLCLKAFTLYFEKVVELSNQMEEVFLKYYDTRNRKPVERMLNEEGLEGLTIKPRYTIAIIGQEGQREMTVEEKDEYEEGMRRRAKTWAGVGRETLLMNKGKTRAKDEVYQAPEVLDQSSARLHITNLVQLISNRSYTLDQFDRYMFGLVISSLKSKNWDKKRLNLFLGTLTYVQSMLWNRNDRDPVALLKITMDLIEQDGLLESHGVGWPIGLVVNEMGRASKKDYIVVFEKIQRNDIFAGIVFVSSREPLRNGGKKQSEIESHIDQLLYSLVIDWKRIEKKMGATKKDSTLLRDGLKELSKEKERIFVSNSIQ